MAFLSKIFAKKRSNGVTPPRSTPNLAPEAKPAMAERASLDSFFDIEETAANSRLSEAEAFDKLDEKVQKLILNLSLIGVYGILK